MNELVFKGTDNQAITTSLMVAEKFHKRHDHVLRHIENVVKGLPQNGNTPQLFEKTTYIHEQNGQEYPMYIMNRDGFSILVMGFTGKKAMQFKLDYMNAFNKMEQTIKEQLQPKQLSPAEFLLQQAQMLVDIEKKQKEQEQKTLLIESKLNKIEEERKAVQQELFDIPLSDEKLPEINERASIRHLVNEYTKLTGLHQQDVWHAIYNDLYYRFSISINSYKKRKGDSNLDIAERNGFLSKIFIIISNMIYNRKKQTNA